MGYRIVEVELNRKHSMVHILGYSHVQQRSCQLPRIFQELDVDYPGAQLSSSPSYCERTYFKLMLSTPNAKPRDVSPVCIECAMLRIAIKPEEQRRLTVEIGTL